MSDELQIADSLKIEGNYRQAISLYTKLLNECDDQRVKADIKQKIESSNRYLTTVSNISVGEVFFAVMNQANGRGVVLTGIAGRLINSNLSEEQKKYWERIKKITIAFLDKYLKEKVKKILVLDWNLDGYQFSVKPIPNSTIVLNELVTGKSIELAMFVSLISVIINENVGNKFAFSGQIHDNYSLEWVDGISPKTDAIIAERPLVNSFLIPPETQTGNSIQKEINSLSEVVDLAVPDFTKILIDKQKELGSKRITLNSYQTTSKDGKIHRVMKFAQPDGLLPQEAIKIYEFISDNSSEYIKAGGVIIDGLGITYALPMLVSLKNVTNHIPDFLACRYLRGSSPDGYAQAFVIKTNNAGNSTRATAEHFEYKIDPAFE